LKSKINNYPEDQEHERQREREREREKERERKHRREYEYLRGPGTTINPTFIMIILAWFSQEYSIRILRAGQLPVAHTYNPNYSIAEIKKITAGSCEISISTDEHNGMNLPSQL
jgi:hypothetical protein